MSETQTGVVIAGVMYLLLGVSMAYFARRIRTGTTTANSWVGIRTPATLRSQDAWNAGHRSALPHFRLGSIVLIVGAVVLLMLAVVDAPEWLGVTVTLTIIAFTLGNMIYAAVVASAAATRASPAR